MHIVNTGLIYRNPKPHLVSRHAYFPSLAVLPDGRIFAGFDLGSAFESLDVRSHHAISSDQGVTWSEPQATPLPPLDGPFSCTCRFGISPDGILVGIGALWDRSREGEGLANADTGGFVETFPFLIRGDGHSLDWEKPEWIKTPLSGPFEICSPVFFGPDGDWLWPASTWKDWDGHAPHGLQAIVMRSGDRGVSWPSWQPVMDGHADGIIHWEIKLAAFSDGRILAVCWTHDSRVGRDLPIHYALSEDGGRSFGPARSTGLTGQTCMPVILPDGRILAFYRRTDQPGLWAQWSEIRGGGWVNHEAVALWGGAVHASAVGNRPMTGQMSALRFGLPTAKLLPDGSLLAAFWCVEDGVSVIRYFKIRHGTA